MTLATSRNMSICSLFWAITQYRDTFPLSFQTSRDNRRGFLSMNGCPFPAIPCKRFSQSDQFPKLSIGFGALGVSIVPPIPIATRFRIGAGVVKNGSLLSNHFESRLFALKHPSRRCPTSASLSPSVLFTLPYRASLSGIYLVAADGIFTHLCT